MGSCYLQEEKFLKNFEILKKSNENLCSNFEKDLKLLLPTNLLKDCEIQH